MVAKIPEDQIIGFCDFCNRPLLQDEDYGTEDLMLCYSCGGRFFGLLNFMITNTQGKLKQLKLLDI